MPDSNAIIVDESASVTREDILQAGFVSAVRIPMQVGLGFAWTRKPSRKRLRDKVRKAPHRYPQFAEYLIGDHPATWPSNRQPIR